jgi:hypothetical protein
MRSPQYSSGIEDTMSRVTARQDLYNIDDLEGIILGIDNKDGVRTEVVNSKEAVCRVKIGLMGMRA